MVQNGCDCEPGPLSEHAGFARSTYSVDAAPSAVDVEKAHTAKSAAASLNPCPRLILVVILLVPPERAVSPQPPQQQQVGTREPWIVGMCRDLRHPRQDDVAPQRPRSPQPVERLPHEAAEELGEPAGSVHREHHPGPPVSGAKSVEPPHAASRPRARIQIQRV